MDETVNLLARLEGVGRDGADGADRVHMTSPQRTTRGRVPGDYALPLPGASSVVPKSP